MNDEELIKVARKSKFKKFKKGIYYLSFVYILESFIRIFNTDRFTNTDNEIEFELLTLPAVLLVAKTIIFVMSVIIAIYFIRRLKIFFIKKTNEFSRVMPDNHSPLEVSYLMSGCYNRQSFIIALLELIRQKYFVIQFSTNHDVYLSAGELLNVRNPNLPIDRSYYLSTHLWRKFKYFDKLYLKDLEAKRNKKALNEIFESWAAINYKTGVLELYLSDNYLSKTVFNLILGVWIRIITNSPFSFYLFEGIFLIVIILLYIYINHSKTYTRLGAKKLRQWILYKNYLKQFSNLKDRKLEEVMTWDSYLLYAIALNINVDALDQQFNKLYIQDYHFAQSLPGQRIDQDTD